MIRRPDYLTPQAVSNFISLALSEDVGSGDHSTLATVPDGQKSTARLLIKDEGVIAGISLAQEIFKELDPIAKFSIMKMDGDSVSSGEEAFLVEASGRAILTGERLVLNCMQRMSGIATYTQRLCKLIEGTSAQLIDTRKTTPNFRLMEKWAVVIGGGKNHRLALCDMIMLKDNHIDLAGGISEAIRKAKAYLAENNLNLKIEVETRSLQEVHEAMREQGVDVIMLDNMSINDMREAVRRVNGKVKTEASGGISEETLRDVANTGVDFISVGALTHSAKSLDLSLKVIA